MDVNVRWLVPSSGEELLRHLVSALGASETNLRTRRSVGRSNSHVSCQGLLGYDLQPAVLRKRLFYHCATLGWVAVWEATGKLPTMSQLLDKNRDVSEQLEAALRTILSGENKANRALVGEGEGYTALTEHISSGTLAGKTWDPHALRRDVGSTCPEYLPNDSLPLPPASSEDRRNRCDDASASGAMAVKEQQVSMFTSQPDLEHVASEPAWLRCHRRALIKNPEERHGLAHATTRRRSMWRSGTSFNKMHAADLHAKPTAVTGYAALKPATFSFDAPSQFE